MDDASKRSIGQSVKDYIAREGLSREEFSYRFKIPKGTLDKLVTGIFSDKTLAKFERNVGRSFRAGTATYERAALELGGYLHADYRDYEGHYTLVRPAFHDIKRICLFPVKVEWNDARPGLRISGKAADTYEKMAYLAFPKNCPYVFMHANEKGWQSTMVFSTIDAVDALFGALLALGDTGGTSYVPFCIPVVLERAAKPLSKAIEVGPEHESYPRLKQRLVSVFTEKYVRLSEVSER